MDSGVTKLNLLQEQTLGRLNLRVGALLDRQNALILAGVDDLEREDTAHTVVLGWVAGKPLRGTLLNWSSASAAAIAKPESAYVIVGVDGESAVVRGLECYEGRACEGTLCAVDAIDGVAHAVGTMGKVFRYGSNGEWSRLPFFESSHEVLRAAAGISGDDFYIVGTDGVIARIREGNATLVDSPTNALLTGVAWGNDEQVFACGQQGIILRGNEDQWTVVDHGVTTENLWDIVVFQERVFVSSLYFLYELKDEVLKLVKFPWDVPSTFYSLAKFGDDALLSVGAKDALLFDGADWQRVI